MMGTGTVVNAVAIAAGGALGLLAGRGIKVRYQETVIHGLSLCVMVLGLKMALAGQHTLFVISGLVLGILVGEALNIEGKLEQVGLYLGKRFSQKGETGAFAKGFLTTSLIYCVGAMAIVGSIQDGLNGDASTLYTKAMIDGLSAIMYGANMGAGGYGICFICLFLSRDTDTSFQFHWTFCYRCSGPRDFGSRGNPYFWYRTYNVKDNSDASRKYDSWPIYCCRYDVFFWIGMKTCQFLL